MAPKKKDPVDDDSSWRIKIEQAVLNDEKWNAKVVILESAGGEQDNIYLNKFEAFAAKEKRFVVKNICKTETTFMVNQLGVEKKVKDPNFRVFEEGQAYLKDKKDIPAQLQSLIIKHIILKMKDEYLFIRRQRMEVKEGMRRESATMIDKAEVRGTVVGAAAPAPPEPPTSPAKGKGKKGKEDTAQEIPEPIEGKKYNTALRERGEEWRDKTYVDDFPLDGPNMYVAVSGFADSTLPMYLVGVGVPIYAIVQIRIDVASKKVPSALLRQTKRGQSLTELMSEKSLEFWEELLQMRLDKNCADYFKNIAFIIFSPPYRESEPISGDPDKIYDELCYLLYDIQDLTRQHGTYLDNMDVFQIPEDIKVDRFQHHYQQLIGNIPLECVTLYSVIDSILQTVCNDSEWNSATSLSAGDPPINIVTSKSDKAVNYVTDVFNTLCNVKDTKKTYRITYGDEHENHKDPIVINYADFAKYPTFHLNNKALDSLVESSLYCMPIHLLWHNQQQPAGEIAAKLSFHVNVLLSCFDREDVETSELSRLLHILACRKLYNNRSSLNKKHLDPITLPEFKKVYLKRSIMAEPLTKIPSLTKSHSNNSSRSFPTMTKSEYEYEHESVRSNCDDDETSRIKYLFDCPDISELVSASEIANQKPGNHMIDDFEFFEDFYGTSSYQILFDAFSKFNCLDYKYCEVTDCILLMFFNSHDNDGISREEWRSHLTTPLCFQDYFDYILDEHYDWIVNEEKLYDEKMNMKTQSQSKIGLEPTENTCLENQDIEEDMLMVGSLKHQEVMKNELSSTDITDGASGTLLKKTDLTPSVTDISSKSSKKTKSPATSTNKNKNIASTHDTSELSLCIPAKPFVGYDISDRRVEVFGKDSKYFSRDGTKISTYYSLMIPMNLEYIILNIVPGNRSNEFWIHKALGDFIAPEVMEQCNSFRINTKDQFMINIKKQKYTVLPAISSTKIIESKAEESLPLEEIKHFYSCYITWPNGLITETVHEEHSQLVSHVKQQYLTNISNLEDLMRCISMNGEVIIFKKSGIIEVLRPDGSFIKIIKCERKEVRDSAAELSDVRADKSKKGKSASAKGKEKQSKTSVSSPKQANPSVPPDTNKEAIFELLFNEYETIDTSGVRQKWINEIPSHIENLLIRTATDYCLGEVFSRRMDGTNFLYNQNGILIVTFPDGTRIITTYIIEDFEIFPEWTEEECAYFDMIDSERMETDTIKSRNSMSQKSGLDTSVASTTSRKVEEEEIKEKDRTDGYISVQLIYTVEHVHYTTVTINKASENVSVDSPNNTSVIIDTNNDYEIILDNVTTATFDGQKLDIIYEACPKCKSFTKCFINLGSLEPESVIKLEPVWLKMKDSFCNKIIVDDEGNINLSNEPCSQDTIAHEEIARTMDTERSEEATGNSFEKPETKSENSVTSHAVKCREIYEAKSVRFFVLRRELSCSELVHRVVVDQYKQNCRWQSWCTIDTYDTFGDYRSLVSILKPVNLTETEKMTRHNANLDIFRILRITACFHLTPSNSFGKWLMDSKLANKPKYLTYKDLKGDCGKGFYHWMRPYERFEPSPMKPDNALPPRLPRAYVLRTLEQQWNETKRNELKGAKELLAAILRYRRIMESDSDTILHVPIVDLRPEDDRRTDQIIQALAHRVYEDLKVRTASEVQSRARATITTKPLPEPEESSTIDVEERATGEDYDVDEDLRVLEEEQASLLREVDAAVPMSANLKRYWRRRAEELKEEEFFKCLLREGILPPYFQNILGGAIWSELNETAGQAATKAERRRMKCICHEEQTARTTDTTIDFL